MTPGFEALAAKLRQANLPALANLARISAVQHGLSHASLLVDVWQHKPEHATRKLKRYYVKYLANDRTSAAHQRQCVELAAIKGLSPVIIAIDDNWLVCEFVDGETLVDTPKSNKDKLAVCLALMAKWHVSGAALPVLDMPSRISELVSLLDLAPAAQAIIAKIQAKLALGINDQPLVPCHGDLNFSNVLIADNGARTSYLVDYEYACMAEPEYDIAMTLAVNQLEDVALEPLLGQYQSLFATDVALSSRRVKQYLAFAYLINGLWYLQRSQGAADDKLAALAKGQFERFDRIAWFVAPLAPVMR